MDKKKLRDYSKLSMCLLFFWLYMPHIVSYLTMGGGRSMIDSDLDRYHKKIQNIPRRLLLLYLLHTDSYYRKLFYHRIGPIKATLISWIRPGDKYFTIASTTKIGKYFHVGHPFSTIINADSIGDNFSCLQNTTIGAGRKGRPSFGNNVLIGANCVIIGGIHVGNNVTIGAGSVVVKDIPDNSVAVGNPARVIKTVEPIKA